MLCLGKSLTARTEDRDLLDRRFERELHAFFIRNERVEANVAREIFSLHRVDLIDRARRCLAFAAPILAKQMRRFRFASGPLQRVCE